MLDMLSLPAVAVIATFAIQSFVVESFWNTQA